MHSRRMRLMGRLIAANKWLFLIALVCTLVTIVIDFITPILLAETLDYYLTDGPSRMPQFFNDWVNAIGGREFMAHNLWIMGALLIVLNLINGVFSYGKGRSQAIAGENVSLSLRERLYSHIQKLPFSYHVKAETGDLIQRCTSDVETVRRFLAMQLLSIVSAVVSIFIALFYMLSESVSLALISMVMVPGLFLFAFLFFKLVIKNFRISDEAEGKMSAVLQENLTGVRVVRAFGRQEYEVEKFDTASAGLRVKNFKLSKLLATYWATSDAMSMTQSLVTLIVCIFYVVRGEITLGTMIVFTSYVWKLLWPIRQLGRILSDAGKSLVSLERIDEILCTPEEPAEPDAKKPPLDGDIVFDHVTFGYEKGRDVLKDLSFTVKAGQTVAILGATGSGKSSIVHLIQRLFEPREGKITIGGVDIKQIDRYYLRSRVGLVLQEPFLYSKTIRENIGIAVRDATDDAIDRAVSDAEAKSFINESENGFETVVGERGVTLSGGQKQRVAIARTLMKDNDVLIFDDSLSAVDTETDARIREALKKRGGHETTIIISHRIVTLSAADMIIVLEDGCVSEAGTHDELIHSGGLYSRIFHIQTELEDEYKEETA